MLSDTSQADAREERLDGVIVEYLRAAAAGQAPPRETFLAQHPDLAPELARFLDDQEALACRAAPLRQVVSSLSSGNLGTSVASGQGAAGGTMPRAVGPYELLEEVGRGGMGVVYRARHRTLGRMVALKMIAPGAGGPALLARFRTEARAAARLQHPNVVQVFEVGEYDGQPYLALEFVEGGSLAQRLDGEPLPPSTAAGITETLARAVHAAHQGGVVHRDLKPANVLLSYPSPRPPPRSGEGEQTAPPFPLREGGLGGLGHATPKITDFGLARHLDEGATVQTETGAILGTPSYMAPEQAEGRGRPSGASADIYALGAILYELLTGRPPFRGVSRLDTLHQVLRDQPVPPRRLQPGVPRDLETVCLKCLEKEPHRRYATAQALADDLRRFLDGKPIHARRAGPAERAWRWCRRQPVLAALAAALVLALGTGGGLVVWQWRRAVDNYHEAERLRGAAVAHEHAVEDSFRLAHEVVKDFTARVGQPGLLDAHGLQPLRKELLAKARRYYQRFLDRRSGDPGLRRELADTSANLAALTSDIGSKQEALDDYRRALGLFAGLSADHPDDLGLRARRANLHNSIGVLLDGLARRREALDSYREAEKLQQAILHKRPDLTRIEFDLADTYNNLGTLYAVTNEPRLARDSFEKARAIQQRLLDRRPDDPDLLARLAGSHNNIGVLLNRNGQGPKALGPLEKGLELRRRVLDRFPRSLAAKSALAESHRNVADCLRGYGRFEESQKHLKEGHALLEQLVKAAPHVTHYRNQLGASFLNIGLTYLAGRKPADALAPLDNARKVYAELSDKYPEFLYLRAELGGIYYFLADAHAQLGHADVSLKALGEARKVQTELADTHPEHPEYGSQLARTLHRLGVLEHQLGHLEESRTALRAAAARERQALDRAPREPRYRRALAGHYEALAHLERQAKRPQAAAAAAEDRLRLWPDDVAERYTAARELALTAASAPPAERPRYAQRALELLRGAVDAGFRDAERAHADEALASLRPLPEFRRLLTQMKKATPVRK